MSQAEYSYFGRLARRHGQIVDHTSWHDLPLHRDRQKRLAKQSHYCRARVAGFGAASTSWINSSSA